MAAVASAVLREWEEFGISLALEAGQMMMAATQLGANRKTDCKASLADLVTETDKGIEKMIFSRITSKYPDHGTIGEETTSSSGQKNEWTDAVTWIVDPIDGTMNFVHTFPLSCVSIGVTLNKQIVLGVVYNPWIDQLFTARKGNGSYLNGKPVHVSGCERIENALVLAELGGDRDEVKKEAVCRNAQAIVWKCHGLRALGSAAMNMCSIACGAADAYYEFGLHAWDMCASALIVTEAGGCVIDPEGGELDLLNRRIIAAASQELANQMSNLLPVHLKLESD